MVSFLDEECPHPTSLTSPEIRRMESLASLSLQSLISLHYFYFCYFLLLFIICFSFPFLHSLSRLILACLGPVISGRGVWPHGSFSLGSILRSLMHMFLSSTGPLDLYRWWNHAACPLTWSKLFFWKFLQVLLILSCPELWSFLLKEGLHVTPNAWNPDQFSCTRTKLLKGERRKFGLGLPTSLTFNNMTSLENMNLYWIVFCPLWMLRGRSLLFPSPKYAWLTTDVEPSFLLVQI